MKQFYCKEGHNWKGENKPAVCPDCGNPVFEDEIDDDSVLAMVNTLSVPRTK